MKNLLVFILFIFMLFSATAQPSRSNVKTSLSFIDYQKRFPRPNEALKNKGDALIKEFEEKKLQWPAKYIYIRSFKYDSQLEVWVKNDITAPFRLFKTYKVCALAGSMGPKRMEGDYQVPEGFYYINDFNPNSNYYLSLGINYPNLSDRILSDSLRPGSDIYIHGSCITVGCIPITDEQIDELYILAAYAKDQGQDFIPVHIFPIRFNKKESVKYLESITENDHALKKFAGRLEDAFDYFEKYRQLPVVMVGTKGEYIINDVPSKKSKGMPEDKSVKKPLVQHRIRNNVEPVGAVHEWPLYPGGGDAFMKYLDQLGKDMVVYLPEETRRAYIQVEFVVDQDGVPVNFKVLKGMNDQDFTDELINRMEKMGTWKPAILNEKPVARKMIQTITVEAPGQ